MYDVHASSYGTLLSRCIVITLNSCGEQLHINYVANCLSYISAKYYQIWSAFGQNIAKIKRVPFFMTHTVVD